MAKKIPLRQCIGCREMKQKNELIRVVKSPQGDISTDLTGKKPGRGAYVCNDANCFKRIIKSNALARIFKTQIPDDITGEIQKQLEIKETLNGS